MTGCMVKVKGSARATPMGGGHARNRADDRAHQHAEKEDADVLEREEERNGFEKIVEHGAPRPAPTLRYPRRPSNTPSGIGMLATYTKKT